MLRHDRSVSLVLANLERICIVTARSTATDRILRKLFTFDQICLLGNLDHVGVNDRLRQISAEMYQLLDEQRSWLNSWPKLAEKSDKEGDEQLGRCRDGGR